MFRCDSRSAVLAASSLESAMCAAVVVHCSISVFSAGEYSIVVKIAEVSLAGSLSAPFACGYVDSRRLVTLLSRGSPACEDDRR